MNKKGTDAVYFVFCCYPCGILAHFTSLQVQVNFHRCTARRRLRVEARGPQAPASPGPTALRLQPEAKELEWGQEPEANPTWRARSFLSTASASYSTFSTYCSRWNAADRRLFPSVGFVVTRFARFNSRLPVRSHLRGTANPQRDGFPRSGQKTRRERSVSIVLPELRPAALQRCILIQSINEGQLQPYYFP